MLGEDRDLTILGDRYVAMELLVALEVCSGWHQHAMLGNVSNVPPCPNEIVFVNLDEDGEPVLGSAIFRPLYQFEISLN